MMDLPMISEEPKAPGQTSDFKKKKKKTFNNRFFLREFPAITLLSRPTLLSFLTLFYMALCVVHFPPKNPTVL